MSTEITSTQNQSFTLLDQAVTDEAVASKEKANNRFLPYVKLYGHASQEVADKKIEGGHYGLVRGDEIEDLGESFECIPLNLRFKAMDFKAQPKMEVKDIESRSEEQSSGCVWGQEYLIWLPRMQEFATFWFASKSSRPEHPYMKKQKGKATTVRTRPAESKIHKKKWLVPRIVPCSVPLDFPPMAEYQAENDKFNKLIPAVEEGGFDPAQIESDAEATERAR
jgi:hypothetical protein